MSGIFIDTLMDFRRSWRKYVAFGLGYMGITSYLFVPILSYLFNRVMLITGSGVLLNKEVFRILLNPRSAIGLFILAIVAVMFIFLEIGTLIIITHKIYFHKPILVTESLLTTIKHFPRLIGFGTGFLILLLLVIIPLVELPVYPRLTGNIQVPALLMEKITALALTRWLYWGLLVFMVYLFIRWIFVFHVILLENQGSWKAIGRSVTLTHNIKLSIIIKMMLLNLFLILVDVLVMALVTNLTLITGIRTYYFAYQYFVTLSGYLTFLYAIMLLPLNMILLNRLYYRARDKEKNDVTDQLQTVKLKRLSQIEAVIDRLFRRRRTILMILVAFTLTATFYSDLSLNRNLLYMGRKVYVAAHRAETVNAPENSLSAIKSAMEQGADVIEFDVQLSKDGVVVLHHDLTLERVAGINRRVNELTYDELIQLDIGSEFSPEFSSETILSLKQALQFIDGQAGVLIDVKSYGSAQEMAERIVQAVEAADMVEAVLVQSFDYTFLKAVRALNPSIQLGQIMYYALGNLDKLEVDFYSIQKGMLSRDLVRRARQAKRGLWVWTVNNEEEFKEVLQYDIDGIITSHVTMAKKIIGVEAVLIPEPMTEQEAVEEAQEQGEV